MKPNFTIHRTPSFRVLEEDQLYTIHTSVLEVLERTGIIVQNEEARKLLKKAGCRFDGDRAHYPGRLVERCLESAPSRIAVFDRNARPAMHLESTNIYFGMGSDTLYAYDPESGELKTSEAADVAHAATVADACEHIDYLMSLGIVNDVSQSVNDLVQFQQMVENSTKPICFTAHHRANLQAIIDMAAAVAGGLEALQTNPFVIHYSEPNSPLMLTETALDKLLLCAQLRIPLLFTPGSMTGGTAPATRAGAMVISVAESLAGLVIHQLHSEGAPIICGGNSMVMDLMTTICSYGAPEFQLVIAGYSELFHYYKLPVWGFAGCSDSHILDEQAAIEATFSIMMNAMAGTNLIHDVGYLSSGLTGSCEMIVMSDEIIGMVKRMLRGIPVDRDSLATEAIHRVGPGGHFLMEEHTLKHMRSEFWRPQILNRDPLETWQNKGAKPMRERLNERVREILADHSAEPLNEDIRETMAGIIARRTQQAS
jgi:trimethylamine--corrinoid protein Co-methyltransferase